MSFWSDKTVLVTGGTGFVGSWLVKELIELGANVLVFADKIINTSIFSIENLKLKVQYIQGFIEDYDTIIKIFQSNKVNIVYHLAAQSDISTGKKDPYKTYETNIKGTYNLMEAIKNHRKFINGVIIASSESVYGNQQPLPFYENTPLKATDPYSVSKICSEYIGYSYFYNFELPVVIIRKANTFGGGDHNFNHITPYTISHLLKNTKIILRSDGKSIRNYIYVKDVVDAYILLGENLKQKNIIGNIFNISSSNCLEAIELVRKIRSLMNKEHVGIEASNVAKDENKQQFSDSSKIKTIIGWQPKYSIEDGLKETIVWYKKNLDSRL